MSKNVFGNLLVPFSEYPLTHRFYDGRLPKIIFVSSLLTISGLVVFNLFSQGKYREYDTVLQSHFRSNDSSVVCQPASVVVGNSFFTNQPPQLNPNQESQSGTQDPRGSFSWTISSVVNGYYGRDTQTGFQYEESPLKCNVTSISLDYNYPLQAFSYSICALCSTPTIGTLQSRWVDDTYISLCTSFSSLNNDLPKFTKKVQDSLQPQISGLSNYYPQLNIPNNTLPASAFPNYSSTSRTLNNPLIPNRDILAWSAWFTDFNYTPTADYHPVPPTPVNLMPAPQGKLFLSPTDPAPRDFAESFVETVSKGSSGLQLAVVGIGGIRPIPLNASFSEALRAVPNPFPLLINLTEATLAIMMDTAAADLTQRVLGLSYLCTVTKTPWKDFFALISMLFGSCSGPFGITLTVMIILARHFDNILVNKKNSLIQKDGEGGLRRKRAGSNDSTTLEGIGNQNRLNSAHRGDKNANWNIDSPT